MFLLLRTTVMFTVVYRNTETSSLQLLFFYSAPRFSIRRKKNPQKLNVSFLVQNRRNYRLYGI